MTTEPPLTKKDVEEIVGRVVGELLSDLMQMINDRFDKIEKRQDEHDKRFVEIDKHQNEHDERFNKLDEAYDRTELRLDNHVKAIDQHESHIQQLRTKLA